MIHKYKKYFPTLVNNPDLVYFDSAATTQTVQPVIDRMNKYYTHERVSVNRGDFPLSSFMSEEVEKARASVARLVGAKPHQIAFTSGTTEGLNWIAHWFRDAKEVLIGDNEHTSNILPWLEQGRVQHDGLVIMEPGTVVVTWPELACLTAADNVFGIDDNFIFAHHAKKDDRNDFKLAADLAQVVGHKRVDLEHGKDFCEVDFAVFSAHKMYGPTGIGAIYSRDGFDHLEPFMHGGGQVLDHTYDTIDYMSGPIKHEAGTPNIAAILGFGVAAEWIMYNTIEALEESTFDVFSAMAVTEIFYDKRLGYIVTSNADLTIFSFSPPDVHPADISAFLGERNIAVRVGKVCSHPQIARISDKGILRVSIGPYNTKSDVEKLAEGLCVAMNKLT